jgi:hypothetical protein
MKMGSRKTTVIVCSHFADLPQSRFDGGMADNRTISQLEAEGYRWIGCECCKGTVWVPFRMLRADPDAQRHDPRSAQRQDEMQ